MSIPKHRGQVSESREKMAPFKVEGIDYTPEGIESVRGAMIEFRDAALNAGHMEVAVTISHVLALLAYLKDLVMIQAKS